MSDKPVVPAGIDISDEQLARIAGGECSSEEINGIITNLRTNYDQLVDFTSYVIERVATTLP